MIRFWGISYSQTIQHKSNKKSKNVYQYGKDFDSIFVGKEIEVSPRKCRLSLVASIAKASDVFCSLFNDEGTLTQTKKNSVT